MVNIWFLEKNLDITEHRKTRRLTNKKVVGFIRKGKYYLLTEQKNPKNYEHIEYGKRCYTTHGIKEMGKVRIDNASLSQDCIHVPENMEVVIIGGDHLKNFIGEHNYLGLQTLDNSESNVVDIILSTIFKIDASLEKRVISNRTYFL